MSYLGEQAEAVIRVLNHAVDLKAHRLAGYAANLEFWMDEVEHCIRNIEGYELRFSKMDQATREYVASHPELPQDGHDSFTGTKMQDSFANREQLKSKLHWHVNRFLKRCHGAGFLPYSEVCDIRRRLGILDEKA